jgi:hypothetical protein
MTIFYGPNHTCSEEYTNTKLYAVFDAALQLARGSVISSNPINYEIGFAVAVGAVLYYKSIRN